MTSIQTASSKTASGPFYVDAEAAQSFGRRFWWRMGFLRRMP